MKRTLLVLLFAMAATLGAVAMAAAPALAACQQWTATNDSHVSAGRAYTQSAGSGCNTTTTYYANGSNESMGTSGSSSTTLYTIDNGQTYHIGACPTGTDADSDGYPSTTDCNDTNAAIHPGATEVCGDGIDQDCSGADQPCSTCQQYTATNDSHVSAARAYTQSSSSGCGTTTTYYAKGSNENLGTSGTTTVTLYTNDGGTTYRQGSCPTPTTDADSDGYPSTTDCNDTNAAIHPGATEVCGDGIDQDCSGADLSCGGTTDADGDGYPSTTDCNDRDQYVYPNAFDFCGDGIDQDCSGGDETCLGAPSCIANAGSWKIKYAPANSNCISCHTSCTPGGSSGRHSCTEGATWGSMSCTGCHRSVH